MSTPLFNMQKKTPAEVSATAASSSTNGSTAVNNPPITASNMPLNPMFNVTAYLTTKPSYEEVAILLKRYKAEDAKSELDKLEAEYKSILDKLNALQEACLKLHIPAQLHTVLASKIYISALNPVYQHAVKDYEDNKATLAQHTKNLNDSRTEKANAKSTGDHTVAQNKIDNYSSRCKSLESKVAAFESYKAEVEKNAKRIKELGTQISKLSNKSFRYVCFKLEKALKDLEPQQPLMSPAKK